MNDAEMTELLASLNGPIFGSIGNRIRRAGAEGFLWVVGNQRTLIGQGFDGEQIGAMAKASALVACEFQVIVETFHAEKAGGMLILPKGGADASRA